MLHVYNKKNLIDPDSVLLYIDETHIRPYHVLRTTWSEVGRQKQVPTFGHHAHVSLFGAVILLGIKVYKQPLFM